MLLPAALLPPEEEELHYLPEDEGAVLSPLIRAGGREEEKYEEEEEGKCSIFSILRLAQARLLQGGISDERRGQQLVLWQTVDPFSMDESGDGALTYGNGGSAGGLARLRTCGMRLAQRCSPAVR